MAAVASAEAAGVAGAAGVAAVAVVVVAAVAAGDVRRFPMPRSWSYVILAMALLWLGAAQAPSVNAPRPQRSFASPEEAVAALRDFRGSGLNVHRNYSLPFASGFAAPPAFLSF